MRRWQGGYGHLVVELVLGRDFRLDGELATRVEEVPGIARVTLDPTQQAPLALAS